MGIERIIFFLEKENVALAPEPGVELYIGILGKEARGRAYKIVDSLRKKGVIVETDYMDRSAKAQMKYANKIGAKYTVMMGSNELESGIVHLKNMEDGQQQEISIEALANGAWR